MSVPGYVDEADLDDPREHLVWAINSWPAVEKSQPYPAAPNPLLPHHAENLYNLGLRYHPELATHKKVRGKDGMPKVVPVGAPDPVEVEASMEGSGLPGEALALLGQIDPAMAEEIRNMPPDQRAAELESRHALFVESLEMLKKFGAGD